MGGSASDLWHDIVDPLAPVIDPISNALADLDRGVRNVIPGGWVTVGAAALMAAGIYDPTLLSAADSGALTTEELTNAGYDATQVATDVSNAATNAGFSNVGDFTTATNAGFSDAATYNAATSAGFTNAAEYTTATSAGFTDAATFNAATQAGFTDAATYSAASTAGFTNAAEYTAATNAGFADAATYNAATSAGFTNAATYDTATGLGYSSASEYAAGTTGGFANAGEYSAANSLGYTNAADYTAGQAGEFTNAAQFNTASAGGFSNAADYTTAQSLGINTQAGYDAALQEGGFTDTNTFNRAVGEGFRDASTYNTATGEGFDNAATYTNASNEGFRDASTYAKAQEGGFTSAGQYTDATNLGYNNVNDYTAGQTGGYTNAGEYQAGQTGGFQNAEQYRTLTGGGYNSLSDAQAAAQRMGVTDMTNFQDMVNAGFGTAGSESTFGDWLSAQAAGIPTYAKYAAAVAGGLMLPQIVGGLMGGNKGGTAGYTGYAGESPWTWGQATAPINPGVNPGWLAGQVTPFYQNTQPDQAQYYWGQHQPLTSGQNVSQQWNTVPNAPATPFGVQSSAVGGTQHLDINQFTQNMLNNPTLAAAAFGPQPGTPYPVTPPKPATENNIPPGAVAPTPLPSPNNPTQAVEQQGPLLEIDPATGLPIPGSGAQSGAIAPVKP